MLRWVIVLLVAANAGYFLWTQGHLADWGLAPPEQAEPERLGTQIAPESLRLLNTPRPLEGAPAPAAPPASEPGVVQPQPPGNGVPQEEAPPASGVEPPVAAPMSLSMVASVPAIAPVAAPGTPGCWTASGFTEAQVPALHSALAQLDLPTGSWQISESRTAGRWIVYMGRYDNAEALERKKAELRELKMPFRAISTPGLAPGLALGTYSTEAAAQQALQDAVRAGVRTARVAQERAESRSFALRLPAATPAQRTAVERLGPALVSKPLQPCK